MVLNWGEAKDKVTLARAQMAMDPEIDQGQERTDLTAYAQRKMRQVVYENCVASAAALSRELTRRLGREAVERRNWHGGHREQRPQDPRHRPRSEGCAGLPRRRGRSRSLRTCRCSARSSTPTCCPGSYRAMALSRIAVVEQAQSMPKQGIAGAFNYGVGYGKILGVLAAWRFPSSSLLVGVEAALAPGQRQESLPAWPPNAGPSGPTASSESRMTVGPRPA